MLSLILTEILEGRYFDLMFTDKILQAWKGSLILLQPHCYQRAEPRFGPQNAWCQMPSSYHKTSIHETVFQIILVSREVIRVFHERRFHCQLCLKNIVQEETY